MRNFEPCGHGCLRRAPFWPPPRRGAGGRGRLSPGPLQPPAPAVRRSALTRRPTGLARVARYAPKSPRVNVQRLNISFSTTISGWHCAARREASAVGGKAALRMKTATIGGPSPGGVKLLCPQGTINPVRAANPRPTKNGAAGEFRRAVARALQEGTRARTSGGAARRGSDVGGRQPDPGSPRLPEVRARRLLIQRSRRADVRGCRHEMDFRAMSRRTSLLCRECTLLVLDRNKRRCSTRR